MLKPLSSAILLTLCFNSAIAQEAPTELDPITVNGDAVGSGGQDVVNVGGSGPWDWTSDDTAERDDDPDYGDNDCQGGRVAQNKIARDLTSEKVSCKQMNADLVPIICRHLIMPSSCKPGLTCTKGETYTIRFKDGQATFYCTARSTRDCGDIVKKECK